MYQSATADVRNAKTGRGCAQPASPHSPSMPMTRLDAILLSKRTRQAFFVPLAVSARVLPVHLVPHNAKLAQEVRRINALHVLVDWSF